MRLAFGATQVSGQRLLFFCAEENAESREGRFEEPHEKRVFREVRFRPRPPSFQKPILAMGFVVSGY
jgi:hypothetical protein